VFIWFLICRWNEMQSALKLKQPLRRSGVSDPRVDLPSKEEAERLLRGSQGGGSCSSSQKPSPSKDPGEGEGPSLHWKDAVAAVRSAEGHISQPLTDTFGYPPASSLPSPQADTHKQATSWNGPILRDGLTYTKVQNAKERMCSKLRM